MSIQQVKAAKELTETEIEGLGLVRPGVKVVHPTFGKGVVEGLYLFADGTKTIRVRFRWWHGSKALLQEYAKLRLAP
jgi:hypothetical protein